MPLRQLEGPRLWDEASEPHSTTYCVPLGRPPNFSVPQGANETVFTFYCWPEEEMQTLRTVPGTRHALYV